MDLDKVTLMTEADSLRRGWQACEARLATVEAERDAAQAGEARAVEALRTIRGADIYPDADGLIEDFTCFYCHRNSVDGCDEDCPRVIAAEVIDSAQPALVWLAQQRREAGAEALENVRIGWLSDNDYRPGIPEIWRYIADRAAALRAGRREGEVGSD